MPDLRAQIENSIRLSSSPFPDHSQSAFHIADMFVAALLDDEILPAEGETAAVLGISQALRRVDDFHRLGWHELSQRIEPIITQLIEGTETTDA